METFISNFHRNYTNYYIMYTVNTVGTQDLEPLTYYSILTCAATTELHKIVKTNTHGSKTV